VSLGRQEDCSSDSEKNEKAAGTAQPYQTVGMSQPQP
jgi:hypothetical protein